MDESYEAVSSMIHSSVTDCPTEIDLILQIKIKRWDANLTINQQAFASKIEFWNILTLAIIIIVIIYPCNRMKLRNGTKSI